MADASPISEGKTMNMRLDDYRVVANLKDVDREIARLALLCRVNVLQRSVIDRVLQRDASVCETDNSHFPDLPADWRRV
jgi:hypothetical protein